MEICFEEDSKHFVLSLQAMWMAVPLETRMVFNGRARWCVGTIRSPSVSFDVHCCLRLQFSQQRVNA